MSAAYLTFEEVETVVELWGLLVLLWVLLVLLCELLMLLGELPRVSIFATKALHHVTTTKTALHILTWQVVKTYLVVWTEEDVGEDEWVELLAKISGNYNPA